MDVSQLSTSEGHEKSSLESGLASTEVKLFEILYELLSKDSTFMSDDDEFNAL